MSHKPMKPVTAPKPGSQKDLPPLGGCRDGEPNPSQCC